MGWGSGSCCWAQHAAVVWLRVVGFVVVTLLATARGGHAEDSDLRRYYFGFRFGEFTPGLLKAHDLAGGSIGMNLDRYFGFELSLDSYETKVGEVGEMSVLGLVPQARLRYPLFEDRLTPYLLAGVGLAVTQANDARASIDWRGGKNGVQVMGSAGGGVEYFIADNIAFGLEGKYLASGDVDYTTGGQQDSINISSGVVTLGLRVFYPELHPGEDAEVAAKSPVRFYAGLRTGGALLINQEPFDGVETSSEQPVFGSNFSQLVGATVGATIGRYAAVEMTLDNYELRMALPDLGGIGEYAVFPIAVQGRLRWPLLDDMLEPYALGGVGGEYAQLNDRTEAGNSLALSARDLSLMGVLGAGIEYRVMSNVSIGGEAKYVISRGHEFQIGDQPALQGNFDSFMLAVGVRIFLFNV